MTPVFSAIVLMLALSGTASGLQCYSCEGFEDDICGRDPTRAGIVTCASNEMCNVLRTETVKSNSRMVKYSRGCRQSAFAGAVANSNGGSMSTNSQHSQSCSYDLCNTGNAMAGNNINFPGFVGTNNNNNFFANQQGNHAQTGYPGWIPFITALLAALMYYV